MGAGGLTGPQCIKAVFETPSQVRVSERAQSSLLEPLLGIVWVSVNQ